MNMLKRINDMLNKLKDTQFILLMGSLSYCMLIPFVPLAHLYERFLGPISGPTGVGELSIFPAFLLTVLLGPITESLIIVFMVKKLFLKIKDKNRVIIGTAVLFSIFHYYSVFYMLIIFIPSIIFIHIYIMSLKKFLHFT